ncbi:hypothetical protein SLA2020_143330 [Shorea laevis]
MHQAHRCIGHSVARNVLLLPYRSMFVVWGSTTHGRGRMVVFPMGSSLGQSYEWGCLAWLAWMIPAPFLSLPHPIPLHASCVGQLDSWQRSHGGGSYGIKPRIKL